MNINISSMTQVFSIRSVKFKNEKEETDKKGYVISKWIEYRGHVTLYKTDKCYHQFSFNSHRNVDEFISQIEKCRSKHDTDSMVEIIIDHEDSKKQLPLERDPILSK